MPKNFFLKKDTLQSNIKTLTSHNESMNFNGNYIIPNISCCKITLKTTGKGIMIFNKDFLTTFDNYREYNTVIF